MRYALVIFAAVFGAVGASAQTALFTEEFNQDDTIHGNDYQSNSFLPLKLGGNLTGWSKVGDDMPVHWVEQYPGNWALMLVANRRDQNVFTLKSGVQANEEGYQYTVSFDCGAGVYQGISQATQAGDQFVVELLRTDNTVLKQQVVTPGAWRGKLLLKNQMFTYRGDGSGDLRFRIYPLFGGKVHFYGVIDHLQVFASAQDAKHAVAKRLDIERPKRNAYASIMAKRMKDGLYPSKTPKFTFSETLAEQEQELADNLLIRRFAESRKALANDPHRPRYHFVSPEGMLNDPNGLCFWQGRWHLFYQAYPMDEFPDPQDIPKRRQHWGHAVSEDLIHWRDLPYAIYPGIEKMCFSGSTVVEKDRVVAFYLGIAAGQMVAISDDPLLLNWDKHGPVNSSAGDSCIWKEGETYCGLVGRRLWTSTDLVDWQDAGEFVGGFEGSCPNFVPIGDKHILLSFNHSTGGEYMLGDYDPNARRFHPYDKQDFNHATVSPGGVHAPSACSDGKGGVINILNINDAKPSPLWDQMMSLPQQLTLHEDKRLRIEPVAAVESLRGVHQHLNRTTLPANQEMVLENVRGNTLELDLEIDPQEARWVQLNVLRSPDAEEQTSITFYNFDRKLSYWYQTNSEIVLDGLRSSINPDVHIRPPERAEIPLNGAPLSLRIFIDRSIVEVFVNKRRYLAIRVYPDRTDSIGVSLRAQGQEAVLNHLDAWQMNSVWPE